MLETLDKSKFLIFLDTARDFTFQSNTWARIDKSTIFDLSMNEQTSEQDYIDQESATTEVESNKPSLPQEIRTVEGNKIHDFIAGIFYDMPIGEQCKVPFLMCFGGKDKKAWRGIATITNTTLNTVDKKYTFTLEMGGNITKGTYTLLEGAPTFTDKKMIA